MPEQWRALALKVSKSDPVSRDEKDKKDNKVRRRMLYVVKADNPEGLCKKIREDDFEVNIDVTGMLDFISHNDQNSSLIFDLNNLYLSGYGGRSFFMVNLRRHDHNGHSLNNIFAEKHGLAEFGAIKTFQINDFLYESIKSMTVCSGASLDADLYGNHLKGASSKKLSKIGYDSPKKVFIAAKKVHSN